MVGKKKKRTGKKRSKKKQRRPAPGKRPGKKKKTKKKKRSEKVGKGHPPKHTQWKPGQSGNPSGLPKSGLEFRDAARAYTIEALEVLVKALKCKTSSVRVKAACAILDRGWGKPVQQHAGPDGGPVSVVTKVVFVKTNDADGNDT